MTAQENECFRRGRSASFSGKNLEERAMPRATHINFAVLCSIVPYRLVFTPTLFGFGIFHGRSLAASTVTRFLEDIPGPLIRCVSTPSPSSASSEPLLSGQPVRITVPVVSRTLRSYPRRPRFVAASRQASTPELFLPLPRHVVAMLPASLLLAAALSPEPPLPRRPLQCRPLPQPRPVPLKQPKPTL